MRSRKTTREGVSWPSGRTGRKANIAPRWPGRRTGCALHAQAQELVVGVAHGVDKGGKLRAVVLEEEIREQGRA